MNDTGRRPMIPTLRVIWSVSAALRSLWSEAERTSRIWPPVEKWTICRTRLLYYTGIHWRRSQRCALEEQMYSFRSSHFRDGRVESRGWSAWLAQQCTNKPKKSYNTGKEEHQPHQKPTWGTDFGYFGVLYLTGKYVGLTKIAGTGFPELQSLRLGCWKYRLEE